mmetsp:Transcript_2694/g.7214  ORF Transcript_2694/g.7214 Transcript_2694/m.7214 type:complete len:223 (-) Transcript_2694:2124-2792(-)
MIPLSMSKSSLVSPSHATPLFSQHHSFFDSDQPVFHLGSPASQSKGSDFSLHPCQPLPSFSQHHFFLASDQPASHLPRPASQSNSAAFAGAAPPTDLAPPTAKDTVPEVSVISGSTNGSLLASMLCGHCPQDRGQRSMPTVWPLVVSMLHQPARAAPPQVLPLILTFTSLQAAGAGGEPPAAAGPEDWLSEAPAAHVPQVAGQMSPLMEYLWPIMVSSPEPQ